MNTGSRAAKNLYQAIVGELWPFFTSVRTTIAVFLLLVVGSALGSVIEQDGRVLTYLPMSDFSAALRNLGHLIFNQLALSNLYRSWWFVDLIVVLAVSLVCCSIESFPRVLRRYRGPSKLIDIAFLRSYRNYHRLERAELAQLTNFFESYRRQWRLTTKDNGAVTVLERGRFACWGHLFVHLGIILVLLGVVLALRYGIRGEVVAVEGAVASRYTDYTGGERKEMPIVLRLDDFHEEFYPREVAIDIEDTQSTLVRRYLVAAGGSYKLHKAGMRIEIKQFFTNLVPGADGQMRNEGSDIKNPALQVELSMVGLPKITGWLLWRMPEAQPFEPLGIKIYVRSFMRPRLKRSQSFVSTLVAGQWQRHVVMVNNPAKQGDYALYMVDHGRNEGKKYVKFQLVSDPGQPLVYLGFVVLLFGTVLCFYQTHARIFVLEQDGCLHIAGWSGKLKDRFHQEFTEFTIRMESCVAQYISI